MIDFGDLTAGDPATDFYGAWTLASAAGRDRLRRAVDLDDATWTRARAWALSLGVAMIANSADHALMNSVGQRAVAAALEA